MTGRWHVVTKHAFRRTALARKAHYERLQTTQTPEAEAELRDAGISPTAGLRVSPQRWHGYWRVEQR